MAQRCSLRLIAANATGTVEYNMLDKVAPEVNNGACIDDSSLDTGNVTHLKQAIEAVVEMDEIMGHTTDVEKTKVLATTSTVNKCPKEMKFEGVAIPVVKDFKLSGYRCVTGSRHTTEDMTQAASEAKKRGERIMS